MANFNLFSFLINQCQKAKSRIIALIVSFIASINLLMRFQLFQNSRAKSLIRFNHRSFRSLLTCLVILFFASNVIGQAPWALVKTAPASIASGQCYTYELIYECSDIMANCDNIVLIDTLQPGLTFDSALPTESSYDPMTGRLEWFLGTVPSGSNVTIAFQVCVPEGTSPADQVFENKFYATDGIETEVSNTTTTDVITSPQWNISKSVTSGPIYQDEDVTYQINVCNSGGLIGTQNLIAPIVSDMLPPGATFVDATPLPTTNDGMGNLTWDLPDLDVSDACSTIELVVTYSASDPLNDTGFNPGLPIPKTNNVELDAELPSSVPMNPDTYNATGSTTNPLLPPVFLVEGSKSPGDMGLLVFDSTNVFTIIAGNTGTTALDNFQVFDAIPDQFLLTSISSGSCADPSGSVTYDLIINTAFRGITPVVPVPITISGLDASVLTVTDVTILIDTSVLYVTDVTADYGTIPKEFVSCLMELTVTDAFIPSLLSSTSYIDNAGNEVDFCILYENCAEIDADQTTSFGGFALMQEVSCAEMLVQPRVARIDPAKTVEHDYVVPPIGGNTSGNPYFPNARVRYCVTFENDGADDGVASFLTMADPLGVDILPDGITYDGNWWIDADNTGRAYDNSGTNPTLIVENDAPNAGETRFTWRFNDDFAIGDQVVVCFNATIDIDQTMGTVLTNQFCLNSNTEIFCDETEFGKPSNFGMSASFDPLDFLPSADIMENDDICCKSVSITVQDSTAVPALAKSVVNPGNFFPTGHENIPAFGTDTIIYEVVLTNDVMANSSLPNPMIMDLLSDKVSYLPGSFEVVSNTTPLTIDAMGGNPGFVITDDYNMTGQSLLKWNFSGDFGIGEGVTIRYKVIINAGQGGAVDNVAYASTEDQNTNCINSVVDINDLNGNSMIDDELCASLNAPISIISSASVTSIKFVKGPVDSDFLRFPDVATTFPNDTFRYKLSLINSGNVSMDEFTIVDILPFIGDVGVRTGQPRNTEWRGWLDALIEVPAGFTVYYSESDDPCRDVAPTDVNDSGPAGCDNAPMWTTAPADLMAVQSFYIDFPTGFVLAPTDTVNIEFRMRAPSDGPPGTACNSFAYRSERAFDGQIFRAEPILCCIQLELDTIGDFVWFDENADGIQGGAETPLENVTMALFDTLGNLVATTITDVNGFYKFTSGLDANETWISTPGLDQYVHPFTPYYVVAAYDLGAASGVNNGDTLSYFPGFDIYLSPEDQLSDDLVDSDGAVGGTGDPLFLQGLIFDSVYTDVPMADYSHDFGFYKGAEIGDFVWFDANLNGLQDAIEPGVPGVTVYLLDENMLRIIDPISMMPVSQVTDANGFYSFEEIKVDSDSDTFFVEFALNNIMGVVPSPIQDSVINIGGAVDSELDSDLSLVPFGDGYKTDTIIIFPGDSIPTVDAGVVGQDTIGDLVFEDVNGNGIQDILDQPIPNVKVYLIVNGTIVDSTLTDIAGNYEFPGLLFGPGFTYKIMFETPMGFVPTLFNDPFMIGSEGTESDADPSMMLMTETYNFTDPAFSYLDLDAGFAMPVSVGDTAWVDINGNGLQDGEPPLPGVTVTLYQINPSTMIGEVVTLDAFGSAVMPLVTDPNGRYKFENLLPGEYYVDFDVTTAVNGSQYFQTMENVNGTNLDASDSDININGESDTTLVISGGMDCTLDAGYFLPVSVGDTVFVDSNANGIQDIGEPGLAGVNVDLYKNIGGVWTEQLTDYNGGDISNIVTDANGYYLFDTLMPGEYYVVFDVTTAVDGADYITTLGNANGGALDPTDSDLNNDMNSDTTGLLTSGTIELSLDAGYFIPVSVGDTVWVDSNGNGIQDMGEPGLAGVDVLLLDGMGNPVTVDASGNPITGTTLTNPDGSYVFDNLIPGTYKVQFNFETTLGPDTYVLTSSNQGTDPLVDSDADTSQMNMTELVTLASGMNADSLDAGYFIPVSIGDTVFVDANGNGLQNAGETGLAGVTVMLLDNMGMMVLTNAYGDPITSRITGADGYYLFDSLAPGTYQVKFDTSLPLGPDEYTLTEANVGNDPFIDSDADTLSGLTVFVTPASGEDIDSLDAGYFIPVSVGDTVFVDINGDGLQDMGDQPLENVTVQLYRLDDMGVGQLVINDYFGLPLPTVTDADGRYKFENLRPGQYYVVFNEDTAIPNGTEYFQTLENVNGTSLDATDSDINNMETSDTTNFLLSGEMDCTLDAGYFLPVSVGDTVFVDDNGNGIYDTGELGLEGVKVNLYKNIAGVWTLQTEDYNGGDLTNEFTLANGSYLIDSLMPGEYFVEFDVTTAVNGAEYHATYGNIGGMTLVNGDSDLNDDMNSDTTLFLASSESDLTLDAGYFLPVAIGDTAFVDVNLNGLQETGEPGLEGILVTAYYFDPITMAWVEVTSDLDGNLVEPIPTNAMGYYKFNNLPPGQYHVQFNSGGIPPTLQDVGMNDLIDSDINLDERSDTLLVTSGTMDCSFDAGYQGLDYGDLPDTYVTTDAGNMGNAPKHVIRDYKYLGQKADQDSDGVPSVDGLGDDNASSPYIVPAGQTGSDDEDGIEFLSPMIPGNVAYLKLTYTAPDSPAVDDAFLNAWIDFDGNGSFGAGDAVNFTQVDGADIAATTNLGLPFAGVEAMVILTFEVPETAVFANGNAFSRFRYSCVGGLSPDSGLALDGEIEDYMTPLGKIGNLVWLDDNFDGLQDIATPEQTLAGVQVVLSYETTVNNQNISIIDTTATDATGLYNFCGLISSSVGKYQLTVITPDGLAATMANIGTNEQLDSDSDIEVGEEGRDSVQTLPFMIMDVTALPLGEAGNGDNPNVVNGFPDNQFDQTYDFAFVPLDFGDLPEMDFGDLPISYQTSEDGSANPPRHIVTSNKRLGSCVDSELDGQPDDMGMGDDDNMDDTDTEFSFGDCSGGSDEDGIEFLTPMIPGDTAYIKVTYTLPPAMDGGNVAGFLNGWVDFTGDGKLRVPDRILGFRTSGIDIGNPRRNIRLTAGDDQMVIIGFEVPEDAIFNGGTAFTRFRLSCEGGLNSIGILDDGSIPEGEVEDYVVPLTKIGNLVWLDQNYDGIQDTSSTSVEEGIAGVPVSLTYTYVDEVNGIDLTIQVDTITDADGKYNFCGLLPTDVGEYKITVISPKYMTPTVANNPSVADSLDSDHDVNMGDSILMTNIFQIPTSAGLPLGEDGIEDDPNFLGTFPDSLFDQTYDFGFVPLDYGDLDSTFITAVEDGGAVHVISENKYLGQGADAERIAAVDSIAGALSDGDDNAPGLSVPSNVTINDDEDGITFITPLIPGFKATIKVDYTMAEQDGVLNGWIDFNGNGVLDPAEALVFYTDTQGPNTDGTLAMGSGQSIELCFDVPSDALYNEGNVHARFRLSCEGGLTPTGGFPVPVIDGPQAPQGEVEDYFVPLAKIGNLAFFDNDLDGSQDGNVGVNPEIGIQGVNNTLVFAGYQSTVFEDADDIEYPVSTDANGNYYVCGLIEGTYNMIPNKYETGAVTPEDTIPVRYILTIPNNIADDNADSDFAPDLTITIPDLLVNDLIINENGYTDVPGTQGFPDNQDQINFDQGWIPEPNIEAIANIAGVDYPESGMCNNFNVIADVCIQNTGFIEMNGELIGARLENIDIDINLGEQFMGAFIGVVGDPIILDTVEYEDAFMLVDDDDRPNENPDFNGNDDIDGSLTDGILEPSEIVCLRITFEISPDELSDVDAMNLAFNAVVSGMAINNEGQAIPDFFNGGAQYVAVDSSDRMFMFDGTFEDPNEPEPLGNCYETSKDLSQHSSLNISYDENCMALVTPQMVLTEMDENCDNDDYPLGGYYRLQLEDLDGNIIIPYTDSLLLDDPSFIGNMYNVSSQSVADICNSTWGKITIENKFPPVIECENDTITCGELLVLQPPTVVNNCGEINLKLINRTTMDVACEDPNLQLVITETWVASDPSGTRTDTCTQTLSVEKFDISDVVGPAMTDTLLNCSVGTMPSPAEIGVPTLNGVDLSDGFAECGIFVSFKDDFFSFGNDCTSGVQRTWTVNNWICGTDNSVEFTQLITFIDSTGPVLSNIPSDVTVSTSGFTCEGQVTIPAITAVDACNPADIRVDIQYSGGFAKNQNGLTVGLNAGTSTVTYVVYDVCGNSSTASYQVTVQDLEQPVTICDAFTTVSLNSEGKASLSAAKLDNGSMDECGPVSLAISRMDDNLGFLEAVDFSCADIGPDNIMVALRVTDVSGNANTCMAQVEIQDKVPPVLVSGLPDITISCTFPFSEDNLGVFGTVVNHVDSIKPIVIDDPSVKFSGPARDGLILDNCSTAAMSEVMSGDVNSCGNGTMIRTITATSPNGETTSLIQHITLVNPTPFVESDITWPLDITLNQCNGDGLNPLNFPAGQGVPIYVEDNCDMVSSTYEDKVLSNTPNGGGCLMIQRTWFVSDWCQKINGEYVLFEKVQMIAINNNVAPVITSTCADVRVESIDGACGGAMVALTASATDDCVTPENLIWTFTVDLNSDGSIDSTGTGNDASAVYPVGVHKVSFIVGDGCGNIAGCAYSFEVDNVKAASPKCFQGLSTSLGLMDTSGVLTPLAMLTPAFIDAGSDHACGYDLQLSFSANVNDTLRTFGCGEIGQQALQLWVTDPNGNQDFCATFIIVEDNDTLCPPASGLVDISGVLMTEEQVEVSEVEVYLDGTDLMKVSDEVGEYNFSSMPTGGSYEVMPEKNTDHSNGVTTLDLILIQKHILGLNEIESPYKLLAADINNNGKITGSDLLELRKLILGIYNEFPNNKSWRFVDANHTFLDPQDPWAQTIPETSQIYDLSKDTKVNFYGLKVGDINGNVVLGGSPLLAEVRSSEEPFTLSYEDRILKAGEVVNVPIYGDSINNVLGYQFTMNVDSRLASIGEVTGVGAGVSGLNFGKRYMDKGMITSSWDNSTEQKIDGEAPLFTLTLVAHKTVQLSEILSLSSEVTSAEAYSEQGEILELELGLRGNEQVNDAPELFQNQPNPWIKTTMISFRLPEAARASIRIYDVAGKLVKEHTADYGAGIHKVEMLEEEFSSRGVYYYELLTNEYKLSKKMVLIK